MIRDALDILNPRARFTATGILYAKKPEVDGGGERFGYEYVNPYSATYRRLFSNIQGESGEVAIRTNDAIDPVINKSYVRLADGKLYKVLQVETDYQAAAKQSLRLFGVPLGTELVMRLVRQEDAWGDA